MIDVSILVGERPDGLLGGCHPADENYEARSLQEWQRVLRRSHYLAVEFDCCREGQGDVPYEQNTQQSPVLGRSCA